MKVVKDDIAGVILDGIYYEVSITVHKIEGNERMRMGNTTLDLSEDSLNVLLKDARVKMTLAEPVKTDKKEQSDV